MKMRTCETTVTFRRPFMLADLEGMQPPGTYRIITDEEEIAGISFIAYRRMATMLQVPAIDAPGRSSQTVPIDPGDLATAILADGRDADDGHASRQGR
jgi:hypothetical protein